MSSPVPPELEKLATEKWGPSSLLIAYELNDVRPFVELQTLMLASDKKDLPDIILWRNFLAVKPTPLAAILIMTDPVRATRLIFDSLLKLKEHL